MRIIRQKRKWLAEILQMRLSVCHTESSSPSHVIRLIRFTFGEKITCHVTDLKHMSFIQLDRTKW